MVMIDLSDFIRESEAAEILGMSRQLLHQRSDSFKRDHGGTKSPHGWIYHRPTVMEKSNGRD